MAVTPTRALGLALGVDPAGGSTFVTIGHLTDITPPALFQEIFEYLRHDGPGYRERMPTFADTEEMTFTVLYDSADTNHAALMTAFASRSNANWRITYTDTGTEVWTFRGYVTRIEGTAAVEELNTRTFTVRPTGTVTIT